MLKYVVVVSLFLMSCGTTGSGPSTVGVQQNINQATTQSQQIKQSAQSIQTTNERIDAKDRVIEQWYQQHSKPQ